MKLIIFISIIITLLICVHFYRLENYNNPNDVINLGSNVLTTKNNIFYGYTKPQAIELRSKLEKFKKLNLDKSNIFINTPNNNSVTKFKYLHLDNNKVNGSDFYSLKYEDRYDKRRITFKDTINNTDKEILFNYKIRKNTGHIPDKLCIGDICVDELKFAMMNGNNTIKLADSNNNYLQPSSIHYSGTGTANYNNTETCFSPYHPENSTKCPVQNIFYNMTSLTTGRPSNCPPASRDKLPIRNDFERYNGFRRFALQTHDGKYLRAWANGYIDLAPHLYSWEIFEFPNNWTRNNFTNWLNDPSPWSIMTTTIGIMSHHGKFLCHERDWKGECGDSTKAIWNRTRYDTWEKMHFVKAIDTNKKDLAVYIFSAGCAGVLSTQFWVHFSKNLHVDYCRFRIIPIYDSCSEGCKADYLTDTSCCGTNQKNIPKVYQCPRDRPKCRFYHSSEKGQVLGQCFKENPRDINNIPELRQHSPHHCKFAKANRSGAEDSNFEKLTENDTFFNEYSLSLAKNEKNQLYETDTISHIHSHEHENENE